MKDDLKFNYMKDSIKESHPKHHDFCEYFLKGVMERLMIDKYEEIEDFNAFLLGTSIVRGPMGGDLSVFLSILSGLFNSLVDESLKEEGIWGCLTNGDDDDDFYDLLSHCYKNLFECISIINKTFESIYVAHMEYKSPRFKRVIYNSDFFDLKITYNRFTEQEHLSISIVPYGNDELALGCYSSCAHLTPDNILFDYTDRTYSTTMMCHFDGSKLTESYTPPNYKVLYSLQNKIEGQLHEYSEYDVLKKISLRKEMKRHLGFAPKTDILPEVDISFFTKVNQVSNKNTTHFILEEQDFLNIDKRFSSPYGEATTDEFYENFISPVSEMRVNLYRMSFSCGIPCGDDNRVVRRVFTPITIYDKELAEYYPGHVCLFLEGPEIPYGF